MLGRRGHTYALLHARRELLVAWAAGGLRYGGLRWAAVGCGGLIFRWAAVRVGLSSGVGDRTRGGAPEGSQGCIGCRALGELGPWSGLPRAACIGLQCMVLGVSRIRLHGRRRSRVRKGAVLSRGVRCVAPAGQL